MLHIHRKLFRNLISVFILSFSGICAAVAQPFPTKPVKVIVPFGPGGAADSLPRMVGQKLSERHMEKNWLSTVLLILREDEMCPSSITENSWQIL